MQENTKSNSRSLKIKQAKDMILQSVKELTDQMSRGYSDGLKKYLEFTAQFHHYSFGNILLALIQRPTISIIAGIKKWNTLGRKIKKGEKGIMILAPIIIKKDRHGEKDEDNGEEETEEPETEKKVTIFKPVYVYDIEQTEGRELPEVTHSFGEENNLYFILKGIIEQEGITVEEHGNLGFTLCGYSQGKKIVISAKMPVIEQFRTLAHEYAHELLHWDGNESTRVIRETEADAVAFVVCKHYNIICDTSDYLLLCHSEPGIVLERLETIRKTSSRIINAIDSAIKTPVMSVP